jgi:hypothetical protein
MNIFKINLTLLFDDVALDCRRFGIICSSRINPISLSISSIDSNSFRIFSLLFIDILRRIFVIISVDNPD